jgi:hypothetical protein
MFQSWPYVQSILFMWYPCSPAIWSFMCNTSGAWWCHRCPVSNLNTCRPSAFLSNFRSEIIHRDFLSNLNFVKIVGTTHPFSVSCLSFSGYISSDKCWYSLHRTFPLVVIRVNVRLVHPGVARRR